MIRFVLLLILVGALPPLRAASWTELSYGLDSAAARLDIHAPSANGPHPVLVWLHGGGGGGGSKRLSETTIARVLAADHVLVSVEYPLLPSRHPAQIEHAAAAVAYVHRNIARYGGDAARVRLIGSDFGAHLSALLALDPRWLQARGLKPDVLDAVVLLRADSLDLAAAIAAPVNRSKRAPWLGIWGDDATSWQQVSPWAQIRADAATPPILMLAERGRNVDHDVEMARQRERFTDRLREAGIGNQTLLMAVAKAGDAVELGHWDETSRDALFAWFDSLDLPRVQRFEQLDFQADFVSGMRDGAQLLRGAEVAFLFPFAGRLVASLSDADAGSDQTARVITKLSHDSDWTEAQAFAPGARFSLLTGVRLRRSAESVSPSRTLEILIAGLVGIDGRASWLWSGVDQPMQALARAPDFALSASLSHRDQVTGRDVVLLGSRGGGVFAAQWQESSKELRLRGAELEGADVAAFAVANGHAFAAVNGRNAGLYQRIDGTAPSWQRVADLDDVNGSGVSVTAISAIADPSGAGHEVLLLAYAQSGRIERVDPVAGFRRVLEVDIGAGFAEVWASARPWVDFGGNAFAALRHPETSDLVHAIGLKLKHPESSRIPHNGAWYLLRQSDGSYSYGMSYDYADPPDAESSLRSVRAIAASPFAAEQGRVFYFGGFDAQARERDSAWVYRGEMGAFAPQRGLWWDPDHRGHGVDLQPIGDRWMLTLTTYDEAGDPVWYAALGRIDGDRFVTERGGLTRYRYALDREPPQRRDAAKSGDVSIRFGLADGEGVCADSRADRSAASALAELALQIEGRAVRWCIEPVRFAEAGLSQRDANGLWYAGPGDSGWGVSIVERGVDGRGLGVAYVYYYDAKGEPRWAFGNAPVVDGNARYALRRFKGYCPGCAPTEIRSEPVGEFVHQLDGFCGEVNGTGSVDIAGTGEDQSRFVRMRFPMQRFSTAACY